MAAHRGHAEGIAAGRQAKIGTLARELPQLPGERREYLEYLAALASEARLWLHAIDADRNRVEQSMRNAERAARAEAAAGADDDAPEE